MKLTIDLTANIDQTIVSIKRGDVVVYRNTNLQAVYTLDACQCSDSNALADTNRCTAGTGYTSVVSTTELTQSDILGICVTNKIADGTTIKIEKITDLTMTQGSNVLEVIKNDVVNVLSEYVTADKKDHVHRAKTRITSKFFGETGSTPDTIKVTGSATIAFKSGGRRLAENERSLQAADERKGTFSFDVNLSTEEDTSVDEVSAAIAQLLGVPLAAAAAFTL